MLASDYNHYQPMNNALKVMASYHDLYSYIIPSWLLLYMRTTVYQQEIVVTQHA